MLITILRDTGATQSLILRSVLPFSERSFSGSNALVWGVKFALMHAVFLRSPLVTGTVKIATCSRLQVQGVALILCNDLAGKKVFPTPEVVDNPMPGSSPTVSVDGCPSLVFPFYAVTDRNMMTC